MINSTCGWDPHRRLKRPGGCGVWVGWMGRKYSGSYGFIPLRPCFHKGIAWCSNCLKDVRHLGQGVFVRPKDESDKVAVKGPKLEMLYSYADCRSGGRR